MHQLGEVGGTAKRSPLIPWTASTAGRKGNGSPFGPAGLGRPRRTTPPSPEAKRSLATSLAREGFDRKACAALLSKGLCPESDTTAQALQALHPRSPPPSAPPLHDLPVGPDIAPDLVARCLRAFPSDTAPGPTGLRVQQLKDACVAGGTEAFLAQLAAVVQLLAHGRAPACVSPVLGGAGLVALPKPTGGVRPIAVGEILRRLTGKCLMSVVREDARQLLWPVQVGVAVPNGSEIAIHTVRAWSRRHMGSSTKVLLKLDFSNAFNCVSRAVVLEEVRAHFPQLARWATWCYGQPSRLQFGARTLESCCGVQQGDPLGPLLFPSPCTRLPAPSGNPASTSLCSTWMTASWLGTSPTWLLLCNICRLPPKQ